MRKLLAGREFQFWLYRVNHGELLVRSPRSKVHPRNIDIVFVGVEYVDLPRHLHDVELEDPNDEDVVRACERLGKEVDARRVVVLKSQGRRYVVVALEVRVAESDMDIFDTPFG